MTDKERLKEIEKNLDPLGYGMGGHLISVNDIYWLVGYAKEQAERVQELEEENKRIRQMKYYEAYEQGKFDTNMKVWYEVPKLEQQNKRYREALSIISANLPLDGKEHYVDIARQALEGEE